MAYVTFGFNRTARSFRDHELDDELAITATKFAPRWKACERALHQCLGQYRRGPGHGNRWRSYDRVAGAERSHILRK